ncbi:MAG: hypothetical protein J0L64_20350 [Acidobacteria bacterium]|nr:hypothetical protein [Acidobacteriota bacterium]
MNLKTASMIALAATAVWTILLGLDLLSVMWSLVTGYFGFFTGIKVLIRAGLNVLVSLALAVFFFAFMKAQQQ